MQILIWAGCRVVIGYAAKGQRARCWDAPVFARIDPSVGTIPVDAKNGFAPIDAVGGGNNVFNSLIVSVPTGFTFTDLIFDTLKASQISVTAFNNGTVVGTYSNNVGAGEVWGLNRGGRPGP